MGAENKGHGMAWRVEVTAECVALRESQRTGLACMTMREEQGSGRKEAIPRWKGGQQVTCLGGVKDSAWV